MADLLSREGHPSATRVSAAREKDKEPEGGTSARRAIGMAAGAMLVVGTVVAGALGMNQKPNASPTASGGEPVGALPSPGAPIAPDTAQGPAAAAEPVSQPFTNTAAESAPQASPSPAGEIGRPARVPPPLAAPAPKPVQPPVAQQPAPEAPAPQAPAAGPVQSLTEPVADTVGGGTLSGTLAPVTGAVDDTLQPALSLIGGLLGR